MSKKCYLCNSKKIVIQEGNVRDNHTLSVLKCQKCSLIFLNNTNHITEDFYKSGNMLPAKFNFKNWEKRAHSDDLRRYNLLKDSLVGKILIDLGAGAGGFIKMAKKVAANCFAVELDENSKKYLINNAINVEENIFNCPKADIITLFHVLEHVKDPIIFLAELKQCLKNNQSEIIIEVPNADDALISLYKCKAFLDYTWWSCHLYTFNLHTLSLVVIKAGYKINYFKKIQRYGLINHLYWIFKGKPGGHIVYKKFNNKTINDIYAAILSFLGKTDTILISISPNKSHK